MIIETEEERQAEHDRAEAYILERILVDPLSGCWEWQKGSSRGYGVMRWGDTIWRAHRFSYHYLKTYLHKAEPVHHTCAHQLCVNPDHLQAVTAAENTAEMMARNYLLEEIEGLRIELDQTTGLLLARETEVLYLEDLIATMKETS